MLGKKGKGGRGKVVEVDIDGGNGCGIFRGRKGEKNNMSDNNVSIEYSNQKSKHSIA